MDFQRKTVGNLVTCIDSLRFFGRPHTDYDFKARDPQEAQRQLVTLQDEQSKLSKQINKKVMSMFEK